MDHEVRVAIDTAAAARDAASLLADVIRTAVDQRGRCTMAVSGGRSPWAMLDRLARDDLPWTAVSIWQVDERIAPADDPARNVVGIRHALGDHPVHLHPMPVEAGDLEAAAARYAAALRRVAGGPPVLDLVHLGLGADGHTASLIASDPVLDVSSADVALAGPHQGRWRMTLTYPVLDRARRLLWLVTGSDKAAVLPRLRDGDRSIPAGRVCRDRALVLADSAAAARLD